MQGRGRDLSSHNSLCGRCPACHSLISFRVVQELRMPLMRWERTWALSLADLHLCRRRPSSSPLTAPSDQCLQTMAPPSASSRKRGAADNVVDVEIFNGTPSVQRRIRRRRAGESGRRGTCHAAVKQYLPWAGELMRCHQLPCSPAPLSIVTEVLSQCPLPHAVQWSAHRLRLTRRLPRTRPRWW